MAQDHTHIEEIDDYLSGQLEDKDRHNFEKRLREDDIIQNEVNITRQVIEGVRGASFKQMLKNLHSKIFGASS